MCINLMLSLRSIMPSGDVNVLKRIEKADRLADKAAKRLMSALSKTSWNMKRIAPVAVDTPKWHALSFSKDTHISPHSDTKAALRRLLRKKNGKRRMFSVGDVVFDLETVVRLVVVPKQECSTPQAIADTVCKTSGCSFSLSPSRVLLFHSHDPEDCVSIGQSKSTHVFIRKITLPHNHSIFYASAEEPTGPSSPPVMLEMDRDIYIRVQRVVAGITGVKM